MYEVSASASSLHLCSELPCFKVCVNKPQTRKQKEKAEETCCHGNSLLLWWKMVQSRHFQPCEACFNNVNSVPCRSTCWSPQRSLWWRSLASMERASISRWGGGLLMSMVSCYSFMGAFNYRKHVGLCSSVWLSLLLCPQVVKRGMAPGGGGEVFFSCPVRRTVRPVQLTDPGKIKRIRGVAYPSQAQFLIHPGTHLMWYKLLL